jgi:ATP-dependent Lon protease
MATSIVSALLKIPVHRDMAMTGEITLRGRVLPIGGLTEKLLAARRGNIKHVLIPKENERNLKEVPARVLKMLHIELVEHMDEVLEKALVLSKGHILLSDVPLESVSPEIAATVNNVPH